MSGFRGSSTLPLVLSLFLVACGDGSGDEDAGARDASLADAGAGDAGALDAGVADAGAPDSGVSDGGPADGGAVDGGSVDGGPADGGAVDGGSVDGGSVDGGACGCIDSTLSWRYSGGLAVLRAGSRIDACRDFAYARTIGSGPTVMCEDEVPCLGDEATIGDVNRALADDQVQTAFAAAPILYGRDTRLFDGQVFIIEYRGREITVGAPCAGTASCTPIPVGVETLKDVLDSLQDERLESEPCVSVFPPT